jgi:hypothetical protein
LTDRVGLERLQTAQFDGDAAAKIDPEVQTRLEKQENRQDA